MWHRREVTQDGSMDSGGFHHSAVAVGLSLLWAGAPGWLGDIFRVRNILTEAARFEVCTS